MFDFSILENIIYFGFFGIVILLIVLVIYIPQIISSRLVKEQSNSKSSPVSFIPLYITLIIILFVPLMYLIIFIFGVAGDSTGFWPTLPLLIFLLILNILSIRWLIKKSFNIEKIFNDKEPTSSSPDAERVGFKIGRK